MRRLAFTLWLSVFMANILAANPWEKYFPLKKGNYWSYSDGTSAKVTHKSGPRFYIKVNAPANTLELLKKGWYRWDNNGTLVFRKVLGSNVQLLYKFSAPIGFSYSFEPGITATLVSKNATVTVPAGTFTGCIRFDFKLPLVQGAGMVSRWYAPQVGLVKVQIFPLVATTEPVPFIGLTGASINGQWIGGTVSASLSPPVLTVPGSSSEPAPYILNAVYTLFNGTAQPMKYIFFTTQRYDVRIEDTAGNVVYTWSTDKVFATEYGALDLAPGAAQSYEIQLTPELAPGTYKIRGYLAMPGGVVPPSFLQGISKLTITVP